MDSTVAKLIRIQMLVDKIGDMFPTYKNPDVGQDSLYLIGDEMRPIRVELDGIIASVGEDHPQSRPYPSSPHTLLLF